MVTRFVAIASAVLIAAGMPGPQAAHVSDEDVVRAYRVIVSDARLTGRTSDRPMVILRRTTVDPSWNWSVPTGSTLPDFMNVRKRLSYVTPATVETFLQTVGERQPLPATTLESAGGVLDDAEIDAIFNAKDGWREFYRRFPTATGLVGLSRMAINIDAGEALGYVQRSCGLLCGEGFYVQLRAGPSGWEVVKVDLIWES